MVSELDSVRSTALTHCVWLMLGKADHAGGLYRTSLTQEEKTAYIQADLCLINAPSKGEIPGAVTRWDDLQWPHVVQTDSVHFVVSDFEITLMFLYYRSLIRVID